MALPVFGLRESFIFESCVSKPGSRLFSQTGVAPSLLQKRVLPWRHFTPPFDARGLNASGGLPGIQLRSTQESFFFHTPLVPIAQRLCRAIKRRIFVGRRGLAVGWSTH